MESAQQAVALGAKFRHAVSSESCGYSILSLKSTGEPLTRCMNSCWVDKHLDTHHLPDDSVSERVSLSPLLMLNSFTALMYLCKDPKIDEATQEPENCRDMTAWGERHVFLMFHLQMKKYFQSETEADSVHC